MKQTFDTDDILFKILKDSGIVEDLSGDLYHQGERPDDSEQEDIVVNTIELTQDVKPQLGVSNVNIHVSDLKVKIQGKPQRKANRKRLKELAQKVIGILKEAKIEGLAFVVANQTTIKEPDLSQHFVNLRIEWSIH